MAEQVINRRRLVVYPLEEHKVKVTAELMWVAPLVELAVKYLVDQEMQV